MPDYDAAAFEPPAPIARAVVRGPTGSEDDVPLLIDTGADVSVVPRHVATAVGADVVRSDIPLRFFDESEAVCDVAALRVEFLRYRFDGQWVIADVAHGVLGRNILNRLILSLDGPRRFWSA